MVGHRGDNDFGRSCPGAAGVHGTHPECVGDIVRETGPESAIAMGLDGYDALIDLFTQESAIKRPNRVEEVAAVAVLLASDAGRNITGSMFPVDGGTMPY